MPLHRILVIDESPAVRETIAILLGHDYEVRTVSVDDFLGSSQTEISPPPDLIVAGGERANDLAGRLPVQAAVLWLRDTASGGANAPGDDAQSLPRRFSPHRLRRRVEQLLAAPPSDELRQTAGQRLRHPYLPVEAERMIVQALAHELPLCLIGEAGTGKRAAAQAIHTVRGGGTFVAVRGKTLTSNTLLVEPTGPATIFIDRVEEVTEEGQQLLLSRLHSNGTLVANNGNRFRLICSAETDLAELEDRGLLSAELYYRLTVLSIRLTPLRERVHDIPPLASALAKEIGLWLGLPSVGLTAAALERLSSYLWFGNLAELEAVLTRSLSTHRHRVIDAKDLEFESRAAARNRSASSAKATTPPPSKVPSLPKPSGALAGETLELIINELAHEFKNPMVTVKTFAQQLRRLVSESGDDAQMARLTGEAVDRMDSVLENLLQFGRFGDPSPEAVPLGAILSAALEELAESPAEGGRIEIDPLPPVPVQVDLSQVGYALLNLLHALTRPLLPNESVSVRYREPASIEIRLPRPFEPPESPLGRMLDSASEPGVSLPLGIAIAGALIERNGGSLVLEPDQKPTTAIVRLPVDPAKEANLGGNGKSARTNR